MLGVTRVIDVDWAGHDVKLAARIRITGPTLVVLLHGIGCSKESFDDAFKEQSLREYSLCSFDFPGYGESESPPNAGDVLDLYASATQRVIAQVASESRQVTRVVLAGHSMGGAVAVIVADRADGIDALVSIDGNLVAEDCSIVSRKIAGQDSSDFTSRGFGEFVKDLRDSETADLRAWARWCESADPAIFHETAKSLVRWSDSGTLLARFNAFKGKAYLYGRRDDRQYLISQLSETLVTAVPNAGHFMMIDNPGCLYPLLAAALAQLT
jgi:pimeloyl-ACP methyl ester carboxylesterase